MSTFLEKGYGWPLFVIILLVSSVTMMGLVVMAARSDGGAQVVDDYYEQAVNWDSLAEARSAAVTLGWTSDLSLERTETGLEGIISFRDSTGASISGYTVLVSLRRPQLAAEVDEVTAELDALSGTYSFSTSHSGQGLWDIGARLTPEADGPELQFEWRREVR